jgi:copper transporter 1
MLFTWDTTNLCIVFPSWRVTGTFSLIWSLIAVVALTAGYEAIREVSRRYEERVAENAKNAPRKSYTVVVFCYYCLDFWRYWC